MRTFAEPGGDMDGLAEIHSGDDEAVEGAAECGEYTEEYGARGCYVGVGGGGEVV